jgi:secreted PhoX family phosphatase
MMFSRSRRTFLRRALAAGAACAAPFESLQRLAEAGGRAQNGRGYGDLRPAIDETTKLPLLHLPDGFRYMSFGWTGDPMADGIRTPALHDGMAAFEGADGLVDLIRNHEVAAGAAFDKSLAYDPGAGGGTTTVTFDPKAGRIVRARSSLAGTVRNCAGGTTPWGSWLTCEESLLGPGEAEGLTKPHGYIFEVPLSGRATAQPLVAMGRFVHEAVAVDPETSIVYETEDARQCGLYRFVPRTPRRLADGGRLQMLGIQGQPRFDLQLGHPVGSRFPIHWVDIADPDRPHADAGKRTGQGLFEQGLARGGAIFSRLEGACYADGRIYVTSTDGGAARMGQVWELDIKGQQVRLVYESPGPGTLNMPDNIAMSPRGGLVLCEDGTANPCVHGLTPGGRLVRFARNNVVLNGERGGIKGDFRTREFAGATYSPDGEWLFLNIQTPGITCAITGPWQPGLV